MSIQVEPARTVVTTSLAAEDVLAAYRGERRAPSSCMRRRDR